MRLFIAIDPSAEQREGLQSLQQRLAGSLDGVKWARPEGLHLTLKFLGEQEEDLIPEIIAAMEKVAALTTPFNLQFGQAGVFPSPQRARIIWTGVRSGAAGVKKLAAILEEALEEKGFPADNRTFKAHLTLGRIRRPLPEETVQRLLGTESSFTTETAAVRSMRLYESRLSRQGANYTILNETLFMEK
jgi:2'-5' RNA ligase